MNSKKSFVGYHDWLPIFKNLNKEEAGMLIIHLLEYVNGLNPEPPDRITKLVFEPIKLQLQRDSIKWQETLEKRSKAGQASAAKRQQDATKPTSIDTCQQVDTVNENVPVNENVNDIEIKREKISPPSKSNSFISIENLEKHMLSDEKWIESISMQNHFTNETTIDWIKNYVLKLKAENESGKSSTDCFSHCARWINQEKSKLNKNGNKRNCNNTTEKEFVDAVANGINRAFTERNQHLQ